MSINPRGIHALVFESVFDPSPSYTKPREAIRRLLSNDLGVRHSKRQQVSSERNVQCNFFTWKSWSSNASASFVLTDNYFIMGFLRNANAGRFDCALIRGHHSPMLTLTAEYSGPAYSSTTKRTIYIKTVYIFIAFRTIQPQFSWFQLHWFRYISHELFETWYSDILVKWTAWLLYIL